MKTIAILTLFSILSISTYAQSPFKTEAEVVKYMVGKTFVNDQAGVKITYGYISSLKTYGITIKNKMSGTHYYINCNVNPQGHYCDISGNSITTAQRFEFRAFTDRLVVNFNKPQSITYYLSEE